MVGFPHRIGRRFAVGGLLGWTLACSLTPPPPPPPPPPPEAAPAPALQQAWAVILWGSTDRAEADRWLARYEAGGGPTREGVPMVVPSSRLEGLKPGFEVVIASVLESEAEARILVERYRALPLAGLDISGAYVREVRFPHPEALSADEILPAPR